VGSWGEIGSEGGGGEGCGVGGESGGGDNESRLEVCDWLGVRKVGNKDLRRVDRGIRFVAGMGVSEGGGGESDDGGDGETGLGGAS